MTEEMSEKVEMIIGEKLENPDDQTELLETEPGHEQAEPEVEAYHHGHHHHHRHFFSMCPHCGSSGRHRHHHYRGWYRVHCWNCRRHYRIHFR